MEIVRIQQVNYARGIAALAVCWFHLTTCYPITAKYDGLVTAGKYGQYGVHCFFVISGFVIPYFMIASKYVIFKFWNFITRRVIRLSIPYYSSIILIIIFTLIIQELPFYNGVESSYDFFAVISHFLYITPFIGENWLNEVYWTLCVELQFYIFIGLTLKLLVNIKTKIIIYFTLFIMSNLVVSSSVIHYFPYWFPFFMIGVETCLIKVKKIKNNEYFFFTIINCILICKTYDNYAICILVSVTTSLLILINKPNLKIRVLNFFGNISFSLYLIHVPVGQRFMNFAFRVFGENQYTVLLFPILSMFLCVIISYFFYVLIELPSIRLSRRFKI